MRAGGGDGEKRERAGRGEGWQGGAGSNERGAGSNKRGAGSNERGAGDQRARVAAVEVRVGAGSGGARRSGARRRGAGRGRCGTGGVPWVRTKKRVSFAIQELVVHVNR